MAQYQVTRTCGHIETLNFIGKRADREWRIKKASNELCNECLKKERDKQNAENAESNKNAGLPVLKGSDKQISWAETIRAKCYADFTQSFFLFIEHGDKFDLYPNAQTCKSFLIGMKDVLSKGNERVGELNDILNNTEARKQLCNKATANIFDNDEASWWIDNRINTNAKVGSIIAKNMLAFMIETPLADSAEERQAQIEAVAEATIYPNEHCKKVPAEVTAHEGIVTMTIAGTVGDVLYGFLSDVGYNRAMDKWSLSITQKHGDILDCCAELIAKILESNIPVRCFNETARTKALNGDYQPYNKFWISSCTKDEKYIIIPHFRIDSLYNKIRKIKGSKWDGKCLVPTTMFDDILGFAKTNGYKITPFIQAIIDKERHIAEQKILAPSNFKAKKLAINKRESDVVGINPDLMDD